MTKKKIPQNAEEINTENAEIEMQEVPYFQSPISAVDEEGNLTAYELLVFFILCRYGNRGKAAFPSYNTIARKAAISRASAARALSGLLKKGYITKQNRRGSSNVYRVLFEPVSQGDGVVSQGDGVPVSERDPRKNNLFKKKKERGSHSDNTQEAINHYKQLKPDQAVNKTDIETLTTLIAIHGLDIITEALTLHVNEPDKWTADRGSSLSTFNHNLPGYLEKINLRRKHEEERAKMEEQNRIRQQEYEQQEAAKRAEEERRAALTPQQRKLEDIRSRRGIVNGLIEMRQGMLQAGPCKKTEEKIKQLQEELDQLNQEEAELTTDQAQEA